MAGNEQLLSEVTTALEPTPGHTVMGSWVATHRRRLVPYLAVGGASIGMLLGVVTAGSGGLADREDLLAVGLTIGVPVGIAIGWGSFGLAGMLVRDASGLLHLLRILLSVPAYLGASLAAFVGIRVFSGTAGDLPASIGGATLVTAMLGVLLIPLSFAIARQTAAVSASTSLSGAMTETLDARLGAPQTSVGWTAIIAVLWFFVATFLILGALRLLHGIAPAAYASAFEAFGSAIGIGLLIAWIATIVAGTALTRRKVGPRARSSRRRR